MKKKMIRWIGTFGMGLVMWALLCIPADAYEDGETLGTVASLLQGTNVPGSIVAETELGDAAADAFRAAGGTDIAILNGGDLRANLQGGSITWEAVLSMLPDERPLATAYVTPAVLYEMMEQSVSHITLDDGACIDYSLSSFDGFAQISGFYVQYDVSAPPGERVLLIRTEDGNRLEQEDGQSELSITATEYMLSGGYGMPETDHRPLGKTTAEAFGDYVVQCGTLYAPETGRQSVIGNAANSIVSHVPRLMIILLCAVLAVIIYKFKLKSPAAEEDRTPVQWRD